MKKLNLTLAVFLFFYLFGMAQETPRGFNFQAVARNDDGSPKANASIEVIFGIFPDNTSIIPLYKETHMVTTDQFGVFSATIGTGAPETGEFGDLSFQDFDCELAVWQMGDVSEILITRTKLLSVPYAKTAKHAEYAAQAFFPAGMIVPFGGPPENIPAGWMLCDGSEVSRTGFVSLFNAIGTAWGYGDGSTTFHIPDLRGVFLRGVDGSRNMDPDKTATDRGAINPGGNEGNNVGSFQADEFSEHSHTNKESFLVNGSAGRYSGGTWGKWSQNPAVNNSGGNETRPKNVYVNYIIKL